MSQKKNENLYLTEGDDDFNLFSSKKLKNFTKETILRQEIKSIQKSLACLRQDLVSAGVLQKDE